MVMASNKYTSKCVFPAHAGMIGHELLERTLYRSISRARRDDWSEEKQAESLAKPSPTHAGMIGEKLWLDPESISISRTRRDDWRHYGRNYGVLAYFPHTPG